MQTKGTGVVHAGIADVRTNIQYFMPRQLVQAGAGETLPVNPHKHIWNGG